MRSIHRSQRSRQPARIEMVPLIDCMFLLLTFFIYIATAMVLQRGIPVDLAQASSGETLSRELKPIHIFIRNSGELFLEESRVTEGELASRLRTMVGQRPVVINADKGVLHQRVVDVLDLARHSGAKQVVLAVEPKEEDRR